MTTLNVYLTKYSARRSDDLHAVGADKLADGLFFTAHTFSNDADYVLVGTAKVTISLLPRAEVVSTQLKALREQQQTIRAEAHVAAQRIEQAINSLLAIEGAASEVVEA